MSENEINVTTTPPIIICPKCQSEEPESQSYCTKCGAVLRADEENKDQPKPVTTVDGILKEVDKEEQSKHIKHARIAIMIVAVLTIIAAAYLWFDLSSEVEKIKAQPFMIIDQAILSQLRLQIIAVFGVGLIYIGLFFWAKRNPFAASLTALIIFITNMIVSIGIDPEQLYKGIILKVIIIAVLANGIKAGLSYNQERKIKMKSQ